MMNSSEKILGLHNELKRLRNKDHPSPSDISDEFTVEHIQVKDKHLKVISHGVTPQKLHYLKKVIADMKEILAR